MGRIVLGLGVLVALVTVLADAPLGIGGQPGFGYKQGTGFLVGIALIIAGARWRRQTMIAAIYAKITPKKRHADLARCLEGAGGGPTL
jgi:hypothetical protein